MRALLGLADHKDNDCCSVDAIARDHLSEIDRKIAYCRIIGALSPRLAGR